MTLDDKINMYFFDPRLSPNAYREEYSSKEPERYNRENIRTRFSPLYLIRRDIRHCFNLGREFNPVRENLGEAIFPAILLIRISFTETVKKIIAFEDIRSHEEKMRIFGRDYMGINDDALLKALNELRNSLEHSNYSLYRYVNEGDERVKYYYSLGYYNEVIAEDSTWRRSYPSRMFLVNPKKLYTTTERAFDKLHEELLDENNIYMRSHFNSAVDLDNWILI